MDVCFIIGNNFDLTNYDFTNKIVVGIDKGAYLAYKSGIKLDYAIGDFDSIGAQELEELYDYTNVVKLNPIKDDTDTLYALKMFADFDHLIVLGGITGKRIDHFVANLKLFYEFPNLIIVDNDTFISLCDKESYFRKDEYNFYSFFEEAGRKIDFRTSVKYNFFNGTDNDSYYFTLRGAYYGIV